MVFNYDIHIAKGQYLFNIFSNEFSTFMHYSFKWLAIIFVSDELCVLLLCVDPFFLSFPL